MRTMIENMGWCSRWQVGLGFGGLCMAVVASMASLWIAPAWARCVRLQQNLVASHLPTIQHESESPSPTPDSEGAFCDVITRFQKAALQVSVDRKIKKRGASQVRIKAVMRFSDVIDVMQNLPFMTVCSLQLTRIPKHQPWLRTQWEVCDK